MLVISRKRGEGVTFSNGIHVKVVRLGDGRVRLGIEAPKDVLVLRDELRNGESRDTEEGGRDAA